MAKLGGGQDDGEGRAIKVGALARASGLTVRTLHYYDEIGLLSPSERTGAGHRLYSPQDVQRLYHVVALRQLGLALDEIGAALDDSRWNVLETMSRQITRIDRRLGIEHRLRNRLASLSEDFGHGHRYIDDHELLSVLEDMSMLDSMIQRRIPTIVYEDIAAAHEFLTTAFGFEAGRVARSPDGVVYHAEVTAGDGVIWLHQVSEQFALQSPRALGAATGQLSIVVEDVDAHYRNAVEHGADIVLPPTDQPYGYREYDARDPEQRLWSFMTPLT
ncbi:MerR family transcriptional regulator [Tsukamurella sp. 8F]|uniref:MerR family transcriptional regulator n=1 Tax=unclassified Tsukamurella TaxID=2633480 RepID=UPI0023B8F70B|nr:MULTISPECIES: MerR family transcriptional regulator [unclassified Tsukamurella]MDF0530196.1 MerR family transcriptional regulator [Tsukamurella sp. 8J]MDF0586513.1 MerR family transcriptional regulator [Tsukamurella sp. 8F]